MAVELDTIILAGGNGSRLKGVAATGMKPLLVVNGETLVSRLVRQTKIFRGRTIVVTSPANTQPICDLLAGEAHVNYVVQPIPLGPGEALFRGLALAHPGGRCLVLMGDNLMDDEDVIKVAGTKGDAIGVGSTSSSAEAVRFTRVTPDDSFHGALRIKSEEGPTLGWKGPWTLWRGPLRLRTDNVRDILWRTRHESLVGEAKIGVHLPKLTAPGVSLIEVNVRDIGVPEELS